MATKKKALQAAAGAAGGDLLAIEDVFSTYLYQGNGSSQVVNNSINLGQSFGSGSTAMNLGLPQDSSTSTADVDGLFVNNNSIINFGSGDFTVEFWVYAKSSNTFNDLVGGSTGEFAIGIYNGYMYYSSAGVSNPIYYPYSGYYDKFTHVAISRNSGTARMFFDGVLVGSNSASEPNFSSASGVGIGNFRYRDNRLQGWISNVRVIKGTGIYTSNFTPSTSELTAVSGTALLTCQGTDQFVDNSTNGHAITLEGNPEQKVFGPFDSATPGEGGMVWIKVRTVADSHVILDTERGPTYELWPNSTNGNINASGKNYSLNSDGFSMNTADGQVNSSSQYYASWTFRKAPRFFDVVTYTGDGVGDRQVSHNLGIKPGFVVYKRTDSTSDWPVAARTSDGNVALFNVTTSAAGLNLTAPAFGIYPDSAFWSDSSFAVNTLGTNISGANYVAYLFAHDPLGPSGDGSDGLIACGSALGGSNFVDLGWEPQWILMKTTTTGSWRLVDSMRGLTADGGNATLFADLSNAEFSLSSGFVKTYATGFSAEGAVASGDTYIYIAIRRGPMRQPTSGTEVFQPSLTASISPSGSVTYDTTYDVGFPPDFVIQRYPAGADGSYVGSRLAGNFKYMKFETTAAEATSGGVWWDSSVGAWNYSYPSYQATFFRRAPGFFDVVAYTGDRTSGSQVISHNLKAVPELIIAKNRTEAQPWSVYSQAVGNTKTLYLAVTDAAETVNDWNNTSPTETNFTVGDNSRTNNTGDSLIAYLFATLPGVSKVGSYTGNGSSQTINCGFTGGARFVLIKRTDSTGDWYVWDTARGIVAGNDPHLSLNTAAAEVTTDDSVDPDSSGFIVNQVAATNINVSSASYIFLAIA